MELTTLCYIRKNDHTLMLHRIKKNEDPNKGKWIGVGGHLEENESPEECIIREIREETGLKANKVSLKGILTFILPKWGNELTFLYVCDDFEGEITECDEGELKWIGNDKIKDLPLWEGDRYFLERLDEKDLFELKLIYDDQDNLIRVI